MFINILTCLLDISNLKIQSAIKKSKDKTKTHKSIGILDDIEIVFLHYKTKEEALENGMKKKLQKT